MQIRPVPSREPVGSAAQAVLAPLLVEHDGRCAPPLRVSRVQILGLAVEFTDDSLDRPPEIDDPDQSTRILDAMLEHRDADAESEESDPAQGLARRPRCRIREVDRRACPRRAARGRTSERFIEVVSMRQLLAQRFIENRDADLQRVPPRHVSQCPRHRAESDPVPEHAVDRTADSAHSRPGGRTTSGTQRSEGLRAQDSGAHQREPMECSGRETAEDRIRCREGDREHGGHVAGLRGPPRPI